MDAMENTALTAVMNVLSKIANDGDEAEVAAEVEALANQAPSSMSGADLKQLQAAITQVGQSMRDTALSEKGLNLLIETAHDLSRILKV